MRNLLIALLALSISAHAAKTTLTGTITDAQGNPLNGTLTMKLPVPAQDPTTQSAIQPTPVTFNVVNGAITGGAQLYDVATLQPQKLWYTARAYDTANNLVFYGNYYVSGPTFNLGTATPTTVTTSNISYFNPGINNAINIAANGAKCDGATDDTANIQAAVNLAAAAGGPRAIVVPAGTCVISSPINIPFGMTGGSITGYGGQASTFQAKSGFTGASMLTSDATLSILTINGVRFDANNQAAISSVVNLTRTPESSINHRLTNITIVNIPTGATGITLDGCEDTDLIGSYITAAPGATGITAIHWYVPSGNIHILGGIAFGLLDLQYQNADITGETFLGMKLNGANLVLNGGYVYVWDGATHSNIFGSGINNVTISGSYFVGSNPAITINNATAITGTLGGVIRISGATFNSAGQTYSLFSGSTVPAASTNPSIIITGPYLASTTTTGTPAAGVSVGATNVPQTQEITAFFTTSTAVQLGTPMIFDYPVVVTRMMVTSSTVVAGCSTPAVVSLGPAAGIGATLTNGAQTFDSSAIAAIVPANTLENIQISTAAVGCSTAPANLQVSMQYHAR